MISDLDLITRIMNKEKDALTLLYDQYDTHLYRIAVNMGFDEAVIEATITDFYRTIWRSPDILLSKKTLSYTMTHLYIEICLKRDKNKKAITV
ncbi:hypothetical protein [Alkalihalobacillus sp. CinArs1]|uniref:hypothetical protein n=1 Tax=Alkalihalobacillus sp. CinArs1 TaxID=2995314 RepID=UPI0022DE3D00|nr:hypothetical protein [Alkalihalobacillus sp. CinArs1]